MSRQNKVNKNNYVQRGRLTPDEMAHERIRQNEISGHARIKEKVVGKIPARPAERESNRPRNGREE
jgi:hypothetical protein